MQRRVWLLSLTIVVLAATACGQGTTSTTHTGSGADGTPAARSPSPPAAATPTCPPWTPTAISSSPSAVAGSAVPTADVAGQYHHLTFAQARQLAPFPLVQPAWLPPCLRLAGIAASVPNITKGLLTTPAASATPPTGPVQVVSLSFRGPDPNEFAVTINQLKQGTALGPPWGPLSGGPPAPVGFGTTTTLTIAGHSVTRTTWPVTANYPQRGPSAAYVWTNQGTTFQLLALLDEPLVKDQDVKHMIASMLQPAGGAGTPG